MRKRVRSHSFASTVTRPQNAFKYFAILNFDPLNFLAMVNQNTFISRFNVSPHKFGGNFDNYSKVLGP